MKKVYHASQLPLFSEADYDEIIQPSLSDIFPDATTSPSTVLTKVCTECGKRKKLDEFHQQKHGKFGRSAKCKECVSDHGVVYRKHHSTPPKTDRTYSMYHGVILRFGSRFVICLLSKSCTTCEKDLSLDEFYIRKGWPTPRCKQCQIDENLQWYKEHPEQVKQRVQRRQSNPEYIEYHRDKEHIRYNTMPEVRQKASEHRRTYIKANPLKKREWGSRRDARKQATKVGKVSYKRILERDGYWCYICSSVIDPKDLHFDHVIPLVRGGSHTEDNIKPTHGVCNMRKKAKTLDELTDHDRRGIE